MVNLVGTPSSNLPKRPKDFQPFSMSKHFQRSLQWGGGRSQPSSYPESVTERRACRLKKNHRYRVGE